MKKYLLILACAGILSACSTTNPDDPLEPYNRAVYAFNDTVDSIVLKPVAKAYNRYVPAVARECIHGVYSNVGEVWSGANSLAQGSFIDFFNTIGRVLFNTTMGGGGCKDLAAERGLPAISNDFGVTLAKWGVGRGPYLVLPFFGPSTFRDAAGMAVDAWVPSALNASLLDIYPVRVRNPVYALKWVDVRASYLQAESLVDNIALDKYSFIRDSYLQLRKARINGVTGGSGVPSYEDPDQDDNSKAAPNVPQYDDPEDALNVPQYDDPDSP
ncbi:MlaA family lipoprotein [Basilea psittacipulmonis]|uniref:ABC transporter n=1 Tax=Basilea psittacipulmonis DSM 24701 TaxID=1072685 RepID=A0A077DJR4_9BURK|nr:VacJ family lipoprotein [Basilea psittacipulmonis]AIL33328.1 hypothetical protein IX83_08455 [Basilea psittacipulmonis DSM 24701]